MQPLAHSRCGLPPRTHGATVFCPTCFDVSKNKSLEEAIRAWNKTQQENMTAKTPAERQAEFRARKAAAQCPEVRGIFAHEQDHAAIKAYAEKLAKKRSKQSASQV